MDTPERSHQLLPAPAAPVATSIVPSEPVEEFTEPGAASGQRVTVKLIWRAFRRFWWQALLLWIIGSAGLMTLAYHYVRPTYDAFCDVRVEPGEMGVFTTNAGAMNFDQYIQTQVRLVTNPIVLQHALETHPELFQLPKIRGSLDPEAEIRKNVSAQVLPRTNLIRVGMSSDYAPEAATIVNAVVDAYVNYALATNNDDAEKRIGRLRDTKAERKQTFDQRRSELQAL